MQPPQVPLLPVRKKKRKCVSGCGSLQPVKQGRLTMDKPRIYRTDDDVLLNLQRSLDLMNCAIRLRFRGEEYDVRDAC
ncbi:hypothetical protein KCP76_16670 [Salmonella enterica subsp. enterica serovar Weltevreden]|nr:hypothetical protein KCP76_16670 [Salmonella enterica subsp. enterica serovar Weltevreden]